jgi:hypothetical protein
MRNRAWRIYQLEKKLIKRLSKSKRHFWYGWVDANKVHFQNPSIKNHFGTDLFITYKTHTTKRWDSKMKVKYSPNSNKPYYRDTNGKLSTREVEKVKFLNILRENGLR